MRNVARFILNVRTIFTFTLPRILFALCSITGLRHQPDTAGLLFLLHLSCCRGRNQTDISSFSFCFPGILTMSTPWMTGARPSVGCKCRSYNSWSCRYCLCACFGPNIYVSSSPDTSSVSAQPLPVRLISATGSLVEGGPPNEIILYICK